jgi:hypothetical protein
LFFEFFSFFLCACFCLFFFSFFFFFTVEYSRIKNLLREKRCGLVR